jgi:hypothetical protein
MNAIKFFTVEILSEEARIQRCRDGVDAFDPPARRVNGALRVATEALRDSP